MPGAPGTAVSTVPPSRGRGIPPPHHAPHGGHRGFLRVRVSEKRLETKTNNRQQAAGNHKQNLPTTAPKQAIEATTPTPRHPWHNHKTNALKALTVQHRKHGHHPPPLARRRIQERKPQTRTNSERQRPPPLRAHGGGGPPPGSIHSPRAQGAPAREVSQISPPRRVRGDSGETYDAGRGTRGVTRVLHRGFARGASTKISPDLWQ